VLLCAALGALDELHQYFVPGRSALVTDVLLDTASAALGALCMVWAVHKRHCLRRRVKSGKT